MKLFGIIFPYSFIIRLRGVRDQLYSKWICNFVGNLPNDSLISYPCSLQGEGSKSIFIGHNTYISHYSILGCWKKYGDQHFNPMISIGNNCSIGEYNHITAINKVTIGKGLLTGRFVYIGDNSHGELSKDGIEIPPAQRRLVSKGDIIIGNNVWIGDKATILGGVHIGDNVIIGANSVVTHDIPSNSMAAGMPAKVIKHLELCQNQD